MAKEKVNLSGIDTETLKKQAKTCKILRIVFIIVGIVLILLSLFFFGFGFAHGIAGVLAIVLTGGYADVNEIMAKGGAYIIASLPTFLIGAGTLIAGSIVTSVKIKHRKAELLSRGEVL